MNKKDLQLLGTAIKSQFVGLYGAYLFGSEASNDTNKDSDIDIAILCPSPLLPKQVLDFKAFVSMNFRKDVDVVDLYRADTVTAAQVVSTGVCIVSIDSIKLAEFETYAYSSYANLNEERREILDDFVNNS